jgi:DNA-binding NtrC family response regulator
MKVLALTPDAPLLMRLMASHIEAGVELAVEPSLATGLKRLKESAWSLVVVDSSLDDEIVDVVERIAATGQRVVLMARSPSVELTLEALRRGAWDMLPFPIDPEELRDVLARSRATDDAMGLTGRRSGAVWLDDATGWPIGRVSPPAGVPTLSSSDVSGSTDPAGAVTLVGESPIVLAAFQTVTRVADSTTTVLIQGERGTGKTLLARFLHERSRRCEAPFVAVNCAAIPEHLLESELFGYEKGVFAGAVARRAGRIERASGGTLLLDEVGGMPLPLQGKILRTLQEHEVERLGGNKAVPVDVRLLAATHRSLEDEVRAGRFREDLYDWLAVVVVVLPPLRERGDDVRLLAEYCIARGARDRGWQVELIADETIDILRNYPWPGNVRQLCNVMERALFMADGPVLLPEHLPTEIRNHPSGAYERALEQRIEAERQAYAESLSPPAPLPPLEALERDHIRRALALTGGHLGRAADLLGIHRNTLRRKLRSWGLREHARRSRGEATAVHAEIQTDALPS